MTSIHNFLLIIFFLIYFWDVYWVGQFVLNKINIELRSNIEKLVYAFAVGNLVISIIIHYLGIFHVYYSQLVLLIYIFPLLFLLKHLPMVAGLKLNIKKDILKIFKSQVNVGEVLIFAFLIIILAPLIPHLFSFPTSWDALAYHLTLPKVFLKDHYFPFYSWLPNTLMPIGIESLFSFGEIFHEPRLANFVAFSFIIMLVLYMLYGLRYLYSRGILFLALFIFILRSTLFSQVSITPFVDYPLAFYGFIIAITLTKHIKKISWQTLLLLLVFSFFTFLVKYGLGIIFIMTTFAIITVHFIFNKSAYVRMVKSMPKAQRTFFLMALTFFTAPILYWLVRNYLYTHNPVYPFYNPLWNKLSPVWNYDEVSYRAQIAETKSGTLNRGVIKNMLAGIKMNFSIEEAVVSFLPILFSMFGLINRDNRIRYLSLFALATVVLIHWSIGFPSYRYAMAAVVILAFITSIVVFNTFTKLTLKIKIPVILIFVAVMLLQAKGALKTEYKFFFNNFTPGFKSMMSYDSAVQGLFAQDNYKNIDYVNKNLDKNKDKVLSLFDNRLYYFDVPVEFDVQSKQAIFADPNMKDAQDVYNKIRAEKYTYVLVNNNWGYYADLRKDLFDSFTDKYLEPISTASGTIVYQLR